MWVRVTRVIKSRNVYIGVLANKPQFIDVTIGAPIEFEARHITFIDE
jgi:hypothetical protein